MIASSSPHHFTDTSSDDKPQEPVSAEAALQAQRLERMRRARLAREHSVNESGDF